MLYAVFAALVSGLILGFLWGQRPLGTRVDSGPPDADGIYRPVTVFGQPYYIVPGPAWTETILARYATKPVNDEPFLPKICTRNTGHKGPCNGWPCPEVAERMRAE